MGNILSDTNDTPDTPDANNKQTTLYSALGAIVAQSNKIIYENSQVSYGNMCHKIFNPLNSTISKLPVKVLRDINERITDPSKLESLDLNIGKPVDDKAIFLVNELHDQLKTELLEYHTQQGGENSDEEDDDEENDDEEDEDEEYDEEEDDEEQNNDLDEEEEDNNTNANNNNANNKPYNKNTRKNYKNKPYNKNTRKNYKNKPYNKNTRKNYKNKPYNKNKKYKNDTPKTPLIQKNKLSSIENQLASLNIPTNKPQSSRSNNNRSNSNIKTIKTNIKNDTTALVNISNSLAQKNPKNTLQRPLLPVRPLLPPTRATSNSKPVSATGFIPSKEFPKCSSKTKDCRLTKFELCTALQEHFKVRVSLAKMIRKYLPRRDKETKRWIGGICFSQIESLKTGKVCIGDFQGDLSLLSLPITKDKCNKTGRYYRELTASELHTLKTNNDKFNLLFIEFSLKLEKEYLLLVTDLKKILDILETELIISNRLLNEMIVDTKKILKEMKLKCKQNYEGATMAIARANISATDNKIYEKLQTQADN